MTPEQFLCLLAFAAAGMLLLWPFGGDEL